MPASPAHLTEPDAIYALSFARVRAATPGLAQVPASIQPILARIIHAAADPQIFSNLTYSDDIAQAAKSAITSGADIFCDCNMLAAGINRRLLPSNACRVLLDHPDVAAFAKTNNTTRSAAGLILHRQALGGTIVAIGNAPTVLFALVDGLRGGWQPPAAIFAFPLGFVGASEAKAELVKTARDLAIPYITLAGRRGGSGMAAAAINAIAQPATGNEAD